MKMKYLMIPVLATLVLTGCGKKNQPQSEPEPQDVVIDTNSEEGKAKVNSLFEKSIDLYSNPTNFKALHVSEEGKEINLNLAATIKETTKYGLNEINFGFDNVSFKGEEFARINDERQVEGMVKLQNVKGHHAVSAGLLQPLTGQVEGQEPEGIFFNGEFNIAPSNVNAYFKGGNGYFDLSDEGIRTTLSNANEFANKGYAALNELQEKIDELNKPQQSQPQPQPLREGEPQVQSQPEALDLNALLDHYTDPSRKFQTVLEENGFVIPEEDYQAATAEEVAEAKADVKEFVDNVLPTLVASEIMTVKELVAGGFQVEVNINKEKVVSALPFIQDYVEAKQAEESQQGQEQQSQTAQIRRDGEPEAQVVEQSWADQFDAIVSKFDINAKVVFDAEGYLRELSLNYDLAAGVEGFRWTLFGLQGDATIDLTLSGKFNASIQYNDEVSFALPEDLNQYAVVNFND